MRNSAFWVLAISAVVAVMIPPAVFLWAALDAGMGFGPALDALLAQYSAARQNLGVLSGVGLVPFVLVGLALLIARRFPSSAPLAEEGLRLLAAAGTFPILAILVWVNHDFWPLFLPERTYPGFPHGLGFVIGPLIFAPIGATASMLLAWLLIKKRR